MFFFYFCYVLCDYPSLSRVKLETYVREGDEQRFGFFNGVDDFPETIKCRTIPVKERLDALRVDLGEFVAVRHHHVPWRDAADAMRGKVALQHVHVGAFTYYAANCMETLIRDSAIDTDNMTRGDETMARQHIDQMIAERFDCFFFRLFCFLFTYFHVM